MRTARATPLQILRKESFLLLEVLIAFLLIVMCAIPLIAPHSSILIYQRELIHEIELDHYVNRHFAELTEKLYKNEIPWRVISEEQEIALIPSPPFRGNFRFEEIRHKPKKDAPLTVYLLKIIYTFTSETRTTPLEYTYNLMLIRDLPADIFQELDQDEDKNDEDKET